MRDWVGLVRIRLDDGCSPCMAPAAMRRPMRRRRDRGVVLGSAGLAGQPRAQSVHILTRVKQKLPTDLIPHASHEMTGWPEAAPGIGARTTGGGLAKPTAACGRHAGAGKRGSLVAGWLAGRAGTRRGPAHHDSAANRNCGLQASVGPIRPPCFRRRTPRSETILGLSESIEPPEVQ